MKEKYLNNFNFCGVPSCRNRCEKMFYSTFCCYHWSEINNEFNYNNFCKACKIQFLEKNIEEIEQDLLKLLDKQTNTINKYHELTDLLKEEKD